MSWSQLVHPAQLSSGPTSHNRLNGGSSSSVPGSTPNESYSSMGLSSNAGFHSAETAGTRLPPIHLSQFRMSLSPANFRPIRDPDHYEKIDQIGKGKYFFEILWKLGSESILPNYVPAIRFPILVFKLFESLFSIKKSPTLQR